MGRCAGVVQSGTLSLVSRTSDKFTADTGFCGDKLRQNIPLRTVL